MNNLPYSPKLRKAIDEIKGVLDKYDIAGLIVLHEPNHGEFLLNINPSYSCISFQADGLRINTKPFESTESKNEAVKNTCNMTSSLFEMAFKQVQNLKLIDDLVTEKFEAKHTKGKFTDRRSTDN